MTSRAGESGFIQSFKKRAEAGELPTKWAEGLKAAAPESPPKPRDDRLGGIIAKRLPAMHLREYRRLSADSRTSGDIWAGMRRMLSEPEWQKSPGSFLFCGPRGTGKTTALIGIGEHEMRRRRDVYYLPVTRLVRSVKARGDEPMALAKLPRS